jgi:hypothetical protein
MAQNMFSSSGNFLSGTNQDIITPPLFWPMLTEIRSLTLCWRANCRRCLWKFSGFSRGFPGTTARGI